MNISRKLKLQLLLFFFLINIIVYGITHINKENKIDAILSENLKFLNAHYKVILETQNKMAIGLYKSTLMIDKVLEIMKKANKASNSEKLKLRNELHNLLKIKYNIAKEKGILQYHFILPNNESFYRAHKPSKYGDDLTNIRADIKYTNETKKPIRVFTQGRVAHGFRNVFPIFDKNDIYLGIVEVSFSSNSFQWYLNTVSHIHSHFLVNKKIFDAKTWERDDLVLKYIQSAESKDYMVSLRGLHTKKVCVTENKIRLDSIREEIDYKLSLGRKFSSYTEQNKKFNIMSFIPIENIDKKVVAWIISYEDSPIMSSVRINNFFIRIISFLISLLIIYFLIKQRQSKDKLENQHKLLNYILNKSDNVMLITDFKDIKYSNNKFNDLINMKEINIFNNGKANNILNIFLHTKGYLHSGLLREGEDFISLVSRTLKKDRIVSILDKNFIPTTFKISISKTEKKDYLVTLSDITKMKEFQIETEKQANFDGLTNIYNRRKFNEILKNEFLNTQRYKNDLSIAVLDIDKFKKFNDNYGHLIGDEVLITMSKTVSNNLRETDTFARWGGEEFIILFKNTDAQTAKLVSEKLRKKIQEDEHPSAGKITVSFGVTEYKKGDTFETIFKRCDDALYIAKNTGRNKVVTG